MVFPEPWRFRKFFASQKKTRPGKFPAALKLASERLGRNDGHDLVGPWADDHDLITDKDVVITTPLRIDHNHLLGQRVNMHARRNTRTHAH